MKSVSNISLTAHAGRYSVSGVDSAGAHYHLWLNAELHAESDIIFKNPYQAPGDHRHLTRRLSQIKGMGKAVTKVLMEAIPGLLPACLAEAEAKAAKEVKERSAAIARHNAKEAGPELLVALKGLLNLYAPDGNSPSIRPYVGTGTDHEIEAKWSSARVLVTRAAADEVWTPEIIES